MKRWFKVLTSSLAVVLFITFSCAAFAAAPVKLRTAWLDEHEAFLVWYAKEKGWDKEEGLDIEMLLFSSGMAQLNALPAGEWVLAGTGAVPGMMGALRYGTYTIAVTNDDIIELLGNSDVIKRTLERDTALTREDALIEIYRRLRPGEPPTVDASRSLLEGLLFNPQRYDLARVGRYKVNKKLNLTTEEEVTVLTDEDIVATLRYLLSLAAGEQGFKVDDIDHFGNRRIRTVGELVANQFRIGMSRMERVVRERMSSQDIDEITPQSLINIRPVTASIKEFFGSSPLSQFMDQTNPLAELTHKRRISALGPGGLSRERASFDVRDVHYSHYGRMCPIETPEGPNIGLISYLASYARVNEYGFLVR